MKKRSVKILALLLVSVLLMGIGYAYWTDSLNVTTRATTGNLDMAFADLGLLAQYTNEQEGWSIIDGIGETGYMAASEFLESTNYSQVDHNTITSDAALEAFANRHNGYTSVVFNAELVEPELIKTTIENPGYTDLDPYNTMVSDKIQISIDNIYPGYAQAFRTDIVNQGKLAAMLESINIDTTDKSSQDVEDCIGLALYISGEQGARFTEFKLAKLFDDDDIFTVGNVDFVRLSALEDPSSFLYDELNNTILCNNRNRLDLLLGVAVDPNAGNETMDGSITFTIDMDWTQFNTGVNLDEIPGNQLMRQNKNN